MRPSSKRRASWKELSEIMEKTESEHKWRAVENDQRSNGMLYQGGVSGGRGICKFSQISFVLAKFHKILRQNSTKPSHPYEKEPNPTMTLQ